MSLIKAVKTFIRWRDWGFDKLPFFFLIAFYISLTDGLLAADFVPHFFAFVVLITSMAMYGFLVNDLGDIELDRRHGKRNAFLKLGSRKGALIVAAIVGAMILFALLFARQAWFLPIFVFWFLESTFYSLPPLRLKERGWPGIVASLTAQLSVPALMVCAAFDHLSNWDVLVFLAYATFKGISQDVGHQRYDLARDAATGTATFGVRQGHERMTQLYAWSLTAERWLLGLALLIMTLRLPSVELPGVGIRVASFLPVLLVYLWLLALATLRAWGQVVDPYYEGRKDATNILHVVFPNFVVPVYLLILMSFRHTSALWIFGFFLVWSTPSPQRIVWPIRVLLGLDRIRSSRTRR
jgi:4-hydroxybenzoate polyprenyltransferase